ncbi:MAG: hypothetical protein WBG50_18470 [Desulfomonilaceae bacterium]
MVKKFTIIFAILAMLAFGACTCWGYTVSKWPAPGIPNTVYGPGSAVPGYGGYGGYDGYAGYGGYSGYGYPGYYGGYYGGNGRGYYGRGWRR